MPAMNNSRVLLVRHGRTVLNAENRLRGWLDPELDDVGLTEVRALADVVAARDPVRVLSSPLRRAVQTADEVARLVGVRVGLDHGLIDRDYGQWAGHPSDYLVRRRGSVDAAPGNGITQRTACWNELAHVMGDWRVLMVDQKPRVGVVSA